MADKLLGCLVTLQLSDSMEQPDAAMYSPISALISIKRPTILRTKFPVITSVNDKVYTRYKLYRI